MPGGTKGGAFPFYMDAQATIHMRRTVRGERYDPRQFTAAHRTLPFGTKLVVMNVNGCHSVTVRVNDRGPFIRGRLVDVSYAAARRLDLIHSGVGKVKVEVLNER